MFDCLLFFLIKLYFCVIEYSLLGHERIFKKEKKSNKPRPKSLTGEKFGQQPPTMSKREVEFEMKPKVSLQNPNEPPPSFPIT